MNLSTLPTPGTIDPITGLYFDDNRWMTEGEWEAFYDEQMRKEREEKASEERELIAEHRRKVRSNTAIVNGYKYPTCWKHIEED